jgi:hypothetical protein
MITAWLVIAGLDPAIHQGKFFKEMDARVKPAHDRSVIAP